MSRKKLQLDLMAIKFRHYTDNIRLEIPRIVRKNRCDDVSDTVIDGLWSICREDINSIIIDNESECISPTEITGDRMSVKMREKVRSYIDHALAYEGELGDLDDNAFEHAYRAIFSPIIQEEREYRARRAQHNDRWAFFNLPEADADYSTWCRRLLTPAQAVALSFAKDPDQVNPVTLENLRQIGGSPFRDAFNDRLKLVEAAVEAKQLSVPMSVSEFALWSDGRGIKLPAALMPTVPRGIEEDAAFWKNKFEIAEVELDKLRINLKPLSTGVKRSLYRLVLGMAIARFEYRTDQRSAATSNIMKDLEKIGLSIKEDAIRTHLSAAANDLEFPWTTPKRWHGVK